MSTVFEASYGELKAKEAEIEQLRAQLAYEIESHARTCERRDALRLALMRCCDIANEALRSL